MPQIVEYINREGITPTDRGVEARVQQGRRIGASFNQVAESLRDFGNRTAQQLGGAIRDAGDAAVAWQDQRQIHQGATMGAQLFNSLNNQQNAAINAIDPNDPAYSSKVDMAMQQFREKNLEPQLEQFSQGFTTEKSRNWAEQWTDRTRQHFYVTGAAETARAANLGMKTGMENTLTTLGNTVVKSPDALDASLDLWGTSVRGIAGTAQGANPDDVSKAQTTILEAGRKHLVNQAAEAAIRKAAPGKEEAEAQKYIDKYPQYIDGNAALKLAKDAKTVAKQNIAMDRQDRLARAAEENNAVKSAIAQNIDKFVSVDDSGKVTVKSDFTRNMRDLPHRFPNAPNVAEETKTYINWAELQSRERKENPTTWPDVMTDLYSRMSSPDNPTTAYQIYDLETQGKLSRHDAQNLLNMEKESDQRSLKTPQFMATMKAAEEELGVGVVGDGHIRLAGFMQSFIPQYQRMDRAGTLPPDALNLNDPNSLISKSLSQFRPDKNELLMGRALKRIGASGLSPSDFLNLQQGVGIVPGSKNAAPTPPGLPPASDRKPGIYDTPRGKMKWTGTGWVQP